MLVVIRVALVARRQTEYLVLAPPRSLWFGCWGRSTPPWLDHPLDHPHDLLDPSRAVWTDEALNVSRLDRSGAVQIDAEHQATDLKVGGSNPSRRAQP